MRDVKLCAYINYLQMRSIFVAFDFIISVLCEIYIVKIKAKC